MRRSLMISATLTLFCLLAAGPAPLHAQIVTPEGEELDTRPEPAEQPEAVEQQEQPAAQPEKPKRGTTENAPGKWPPARSKDFGIGLFLGEPTGISFRWFFDDMMGIDALAAWGWGWDYHQKVIFHSDYLFRFYDLIPIPKGDTALYIGGGLQLGLFDHYRYSVYYHDAHDWWFLLALRLPGGILYQIKSFPIEIFFEMAFLFNILPAPAPDFNIGIGARFCF